MAGSRFHPETRGNGIGFLNIEAERAIVICEAEVQAAPQVRRLRYQLARALLAGRHLERARAELSKAVELGDSRAMLLLATMLVQGEGGIHDHEGAVRLIQRAAEAGLPSAFGSLGYYYRNGIGVTYDPELAFQYSKRAADAGWLGGMRQLVSAYSEGIGTPKDPEEAERWGRLLAEKARSIAESGDGYAMRELANAFLNGWGGPINHAAAFSWFQRALEAGDAFSLHSLGWVHEHGLGVEKNETVACDFYERSAAMGEPSSYNSLALCYQHGKGRPLDLAKALMLFERASLGGNSYAPRNIGHLYRDGRGVAKDLVKAASLYRVSALRGLPAGMFDYGMVLAKGQGTPIDFSAGCDWFEKAAKRHHARAINNLGVCYLSGEGRSKDPAKGLALLEQAVALEDDLAIRNLARRLMDGIGVPRDEKRAVALMRRSAESGSSAGMVDYAIVLLLGTGGAKDAKSGCAMLRKGADAGEVRAIFIYGHCLEEGLAGGKQPGQALEYYERAGASGHLAAMRAAARMLDVGRGGKPNGAKAALWLRKALAAGDSRLASDLITAPHVWSIATRRALQRLLKEEGHYAGPADGQFTANFDEVLWSSGLVGELATRDERLIQEIVRVPAKGAPHGILVRLCRSQSSEAKQLVVINHGLTTDVKQRRETRANACGGTAQFFAARGYTVAFPLRRGYGETGGAFNEVGPTACQSFRNLTRAGHEIAKDIRRVIEYLRERTDILRDRTIVVGHSGGGWGALALASDAPKDVAGLINVSGALGSRKGMPNTYCSERHISAAADFGRTAAVPSLWIYVENDSHVGPRVARQMHTAFARGGSKSELVVLPKFETEGHNLFRDSAVETWGPTVDKWLKSLTSGGVAERH